MNEITVTTYDITAFDLKRKKYVSFEITWPHEHNDEGVRLLYKKLSANYRMPPWGLVKLGEHKVHKHVYFTIQNETDETSVSDI